MNHFVNLRLQRIIVCLIVVAECKHCDARHKIKVFPALDIIQVHPVPLLPHNLVAIVGVKQRGLRLVDIFLHIHDTLSSIYSASICSKSSSLTIAVPIPFLVKISSSRQCGIRPSRICTRLTPFLIALVQLPNLGSIPPPIKPSSISLSACVAVILEINEDLS